LRDPPESFQQPYCLLVSGQTGFVATHDQHSRGKLRCSPLLLVAKQDQIGATTVYGDLLVRFRAGAAGEDFPHDVNRKPNGFFMATTRVSAVVIESVQIEADAVEVSREVFPTNNPQAKVL